MIRRLTGRPLCVIAMLMAWSEAAAAQSAAPSGSAERAPVETIVVNGKKVPAAYATKADYATPNAKLGPLGTTPTLQTPYDVQTVPQDLIVNQAARTLNDALRDLPSVQIESRQGVDISRPQSRGFEGSIVQNTRVDGMNVIGTTAYPAEELDSVQVLTGLAGAIYGPAAPSGVFDYTFKRPTDQPLARAIIDYDSSSMFTEQADLGGRTGTNGWLGYRLNLLQGSGDGYVDGSTSDRVMINADFDIHVSDNTVIELDQSHYYLDQTGYSGQFSYGAGPGSTAPATRIPAAPDPNIVGYGQPGAGLHLTTDLGSAHILHDFDDGWHLTLGGLFEAAQRGLQTINNNLTSNSGNFTVQKNFSAVGLFTVGSNTASLNGTQRILGFDNDLVFGTNGYINGQYSPRNNVVQTLGKSSLANPRVFTLPPFSTGGLYESSEVVQQAIVLGDTLHLSPQWAIRGLLSPSWIDTTNYGATGIRANSSNSGDGLISHSESLIYTPTKRLTFYFTYGTAYEQGDTAPTTAGITNPGATVAPYRSEQYEIGSKYMLTPKLMLSVAGFHITRPYADTNPATDTFEVIGEQRNWGTEFFFSGELLPALSALGGFTYLDPQLLDTGSPATSNKNVVGVPDWQSNVVLDYHPQWAHGVAGTVNFHYTGPRAATNTNNSFAAPYATLDLGVRATVKVWHKPLTVRAQVSNVTDARYWLSIFPANIDGAAGADSAWLGAPRTVSASVEVDF